MQFDKSTKIASELIGEAVSLEAAKYQKNEPEFCILLTEELADHVVQMYNNTDWDNIDLDDIELDEDIFTGEMDVEKWKSRVGEHILVSCYGDPWPKIEQATSFEPGVRIDFSDRLMKYSVDLLSDLRLSEEVDISQSYRSLSRAICAMLMDGTPESLIKRLFHAELKGVMKY